MAQISRDNHFVPQFYLKQWSDDGIHIWAYRLLVSHNCVPKWTHRSINRTAYLRDLYTIYDDGDKSDDFENWIKEDIETPAVKTIKKVVKNNQLKSEDWDNLIMLLAAQDVRTPLSYIEDSERWENTFPDLLTSIEKSLQKYNNQKIQNELSKSSKIEDVIFDDIVDIEFIHNNDKEVVGGYIKAEVTAGRKLWLKSQELRIKKTAEALKGYKWGIVLPASGHKWFTSDHPVVRLNYYDERNYDFKGGWGSKNTDIFMPLSPKHLLFTEIGKDMADKIKFDAKKTKQIQTYLAERALRWIFSDNRSGYITKLRTRKVDSTLFKEEEEQWEKWNKNQVEAERTRGKTTNSKNID